MIDTFDTATSTGVASDWDACIRPEPWMGRAQPIHKQVEPFAAGATTGGA